MNNLNDSIKSITWNLSEYSNLTQIVVGIITVIVGFFTFRLALKVHKEFPKNHAKAKQVERMSELVELLNLSKLDLTFVDYQQGGGAIGNGYSIWYNIFEIADLLNNDRKDEINGQLLHYPEYDDCPVLLTKETTQILNIKSFIDNPFIPRKIADELLNFLIITSNEVERKNLSDYEESIVLIQTGENMPSFTFVNQPICEAMKSWLNFKTCAYNLKSELNKWFIENGINDFNLRVDYKNIKK